MPRFTFDTPYGPRTQNAPDEAVAREWLEIQLYHPEPDGNGDEPYTTEQLRQIRMRRAERAAALVLREEG